MEEDRSALFNQLKNFSQRKLKKVETKVVTASGEQLVEKRGAKGLQVLSGNAGSDSKEAEPARKLDLQVGLVLPGFLIASQDVAHDKSSLDSYGVTHILNLDADIENKFEDDYNYKNIAIQDKPDFELDRVLEDCFDFIDDGRHYGNVLIHCSGTIGLSRSTAICIAYLMKTEKQKFNEALNNVKEVRSFVKPNEGFVKQLKEYEVKLCGAQQIKESGIDDPFALRKKQEIEQEKAMVAGAASVKNRMKMFGANLDTNPNSPSIRSKSVSPAPNSSSSTVNNNSSSNGNRTSKWAPVSTDNRSSTSKSMTPEPRKSWQTSSESITEKNKSDWRSKQGPPPPPPPMPKSSLHDDNKSVKSLNNNTTGSAAGLPPPPPPPPTDLLKNDHRKPSTRTSSPGKEPSLSHRKQSVSSEASDDDSRGKMVFGRRPPPPMKIRGGLSIERQDSTSDKNQGYTTSSTKGSNQSSKASLQLPLKKQFTSDSDGESGSVSKGTRAPSPSAALRAAKQQISASQQQHSSEDGAKIGSAGGQRRQSKGQLNRSSTKKLLNLIKTKTKSDLTLPDGDENDEIDALLGALENESIENIDWDELGLDENEVKDIIRFGENDDDGEASSISTGLSSDEETDEEGEEEEEEIETSTQHYVIRTKY